MNEFACDGYSVLLKEDRFLYDFEVDIEKSSAVILPGFLGNNATVGVTAYVKKNGLEYPVPDMTKNYQNDGLLLDDGRIYLPTLAYCMDNRSFLLSVWSGGNCEQCELLIRYAIDLTGHIIEVDAPAESWFGSFKNEAIYGNRFATHELMKTTCFDYIEVRYNRKRLHSSLGYQSPRQFLQNWLAKRKEMLVA